MVLVLFETDQELRTRDCRKNLETSNLLAVISLNADKIRMEQKVVLPKQS